MITKVVTILGVALCVQAHSGHNAVSEQRVVQYLGHPIPAEHIGHHGELAHIGQHAPEHRKEYAWSYPSYEFEYKVSDPHTGDHKGQQEKRHGDVVVGEYWLIEPNGNKRTVKYHADDKHGFRAVVHNSGLLHHEHARPKPEPHHIPLHVEHKPIHHIPVVEHKVIQVHREPEHRPILIEKPLIREEPVHIPLKPIYVGELVIHHPKPEHKHHLELQEERNRLGEPRREPINIEERIREEERQRNLINIERLREEERRRERIVKEERIRQEERQRQVHIERIREEERRRERIEKEERIRQEERQRQAHIERIREEERRLKRIEKEERIRHEERERQAHVERIRELERRRERIEKEERIRQEERQREAINVERLLQEERRRERIEKEERVREEERLRESAHKELLRNEPRHEIGHAIVRHHDIPILPLYEPKIRYPEVQHDGYNWYPHINRYNRDTKNKKENAEQ